MKVVICGGGAAGIMAAISSSKNKNNEVIIIEKNENIGKKLLITGKGRCNITNNIDITEFIKNTPGNGKFMYSAYNNFSNKDIVEMLEKEGVKTKVERGGRIFPVSDKAKDVLTALEKILKKQNVKCITNAEVIKIDNKKKIEYINKKTNKKEKIEADKIIIAVGGKTYPITGSTGDGYKFAKDLGHNIIDIKGSLVPLVCKNESLEICKNTQGLSLRNIKIKIKDEEKNKNIYEDFGEMLFTHFGVSGPTILSASSHLIRYKNIDELLKLNKIKLLIDLKPGLEEKKLDERILRDFEEEKNKEFKNSLNKLLPQKIINEVINLSKISPTKKVNEITKEERTRLVNIIKSFTITINGFRPVEEGIITAGGVDIKEINPKTMESKLVKDIYFVGEILDVDAYTGGFNLQIAFSTGYTAGMEN